MTLEHGATVGDYRIEGLLGRGGMGTVYSARHAVAGRPVALKFLSDDARRDEDLQRRIHREGRLQAALDHPHVVTVYDVGESEHGPYLAMRLVRGSTLDDLIRGRALDAAHAVRLLGQVASALDAAHAAGLVHRDVKPRNVLVGEADDAYLGDFGLTRDAGTSLTGTGRIVGTVAYLAPEVVRGEPATAASDRYAFAAMAFECLTGTPVFPRETQAATLFAHAGDPVPSISQRRPVLPAALDAVLTAALAKAPDQRPASCAGVVADVARVLRDAGAADLEPPSVAPAAGSVGTTATDMPPVAPERPAIPPRRTVTLAAAAATAALAVAATAGAGAVLVDGGDERPREGAPPALPGAIVIGSDLAAPARAASCAGEATRSCTVMQASLPGGRLIVPRDGVLRRWAVRSARGELSLAVLRQRGTDVKQIARANNEFVGNDGVHLFSTDLAVERGDTIGLVAAPGARIGLANASGATLRRWVPRLQGAAPSQRLEPGSGRDGELLLRVELLPGTQPRVPEQLTGPAAARAPRGRTIAEATATPNRRRPVRVALVELDGRLVLDQFFDGRRTARIGVPSDFRAAGGRLLEFEVEPEPAPAEHLGVYIEWVNEESARIVDHYFGAFTREFVLYD